MDDTPAVDLLNLLGRTDSLPKTELLLTLADPGTNRLSLGRSFLLTFVRLNFLGPPGDTIAAADVHIPDTQRRRISDSLSRDGESPFHLAHGLALFLAARQLLTEAHQQETTRESLLLRLKTVHVHQQLLSEKSPSLRSELLELLDAAGPLLEDEGALPLLLLAAFLCQFYYEHKRASQLMETARTVSKVEVQLSGASGKRTRFQEEHKSQLFLAVSRKDSADGDDAEDRTAVLPTDVALDDDTVLPRIQFEDTSAADLPQLSGDDTAFILACSVYHRQTTPLTEVCREEMLAYLQAVMSQPRDWCVLTEALLMRSRLEKQSGRRVQRAIQQLEELAHQFLRPAPDCSVRHRRFLFTRVPTRWGVELELAELLLSQGLMKAALDIFLRWEEWSCVINCHLRLGKTGAAERIIRQRLEAEPESVLLLCSLGDVTEQPEHYLRAWELSQHRSARAMRSLAVLYAKTGKLEESIPCFERSLALNPLHHGTAFSLGCTAMESGMFEKAETAFRRCTTMEPDDFQAWANLSAVLSKRGDKLAALTVQEEALRRNYENWRLWENYLVVATDSGAFPRVIEAMHRLADLRGGRYWDGPVMRVLVRAVNEDIVDCYGKGAGQLRPRVTELLGRLTTQGATEPEAWRLYSDILRGIAEPSAEEARRALQAAQRAFSLRADKRGWQSDVAQSRELAEELKQLAEFGLESCQRHSDCRPVLTSTRLSVKSLLSSVKRHHEDLLTADIVEELKPVFTDLTELLGKVEEELKKD